MGELVLECSAPVLELGLLLLTFIDERDQKWCNDDYNREEKQILEDHFTLYVRCLQKVERWVILSSEQVLRVLLGEVCELALKLCHVWHLRM